MTNNEPFDIIMNSLANGGLLLIICGFLVALLPIVLFFKVWVMTNDVSKMLELMRQKIDSDARKEGKYLSPLDTIVKEDVQSEDKKLTS